MNLFRKCLIVTFTSLALMAPAAALAQRTPGGQSGPQPGAGGAIPLPYPIENDARNATEKTLSPGTWILETKSGGKTKRTIFFLGGARDYAEYMVTEKDGDEDFLLPNVLVDEQTTWSAEPTDGDGFILTVGKKRWQCYWAENGFDLHAAGGKVYRFWLKENAGAFKR